MLFALVVREYRTRVGGHWVGVAWTVLEPLLHMTILFALFIYVRNRVSPNMEYPIFVFSGMMPYFLFRNLAQRLTESIESNRGLFSFRQVKPFDTVIARAVVESVLWLIIAVLTLIGLGLLGYHAAPQHPLELFGLMAMSALMGVGLGLMLAVTTHGRKRVRSAIKILYFPLYLSSGVIFPINNLPSVFLDWLLWNPILHLVDLSRSAFASAHLPVKGVNAAYPAMVALTLLALALSLYRRDRQKLLMKAA